MNDGLNCYDELLEKMTKIPDRADMIVVGDMNARVGERTECVSLNEDVVGCNEREQITDVLYTNNDNMILEEDLIANGMSLSRMNMDKKVNEYGLKLLNLCNASDVCILNGRSFYDKGKGMLTYCNKNGKSTIDYVLASKYALYKVCYFEILPFNCYSDHSMLCFNLKVNINMNTDLISSDVECKRFITKWNEDFKDAFIDNLNTYDTLYELNDITDKLVNCNEQRDVDQIIKEFTDVLLSSGSDHIRELTIKQKGDNDRCYKFKQNNSSWYDKDCYEQRKIFEEYEKRYWQTGLDEDRVMMCQQRNFYRKLCREKSTQFKRIEAERLVTLSRTDSKAFWKKIKGKRNEDRGSGCNFYEHFKGLANMESRVGDEGKKEIEEEGIENYSHYSEILDAPVGMNEIETAIKGLKRNKAAGQDNVVNEFLLNSSVGIKLFLLVLFNTILELEYFPSEWALGKVIPIFKKGDKKDVNNYRGITIISCLAKLFTKIMNDRLTKWADSENIISEAQ